MTTVVREISMNSYLSYLFYPFIFLFSHLQLENNLWSATFSL